MRTLGRPVVTHVREHDDVADLQSIANFDFADGRGTEFHRHAHRVAVAHHIDEACVRIVERAARHLEHIGALVEHDAY
jgi:hypothetical protein